MTGNVMRANVAVLVVAVSVVGTAGEANAQLSRPQAAEISAEFPYESKYVEVEGAKIHYVEAGEGDPILFLHGNPTSVYLWRNIMPHVSGQGRAIAMDLIGMGKSEKLDLDYTYADHRKYVDGFIKTMELENITLVVHDWGSALGFDYATRHPENVAGIAFMEAIIPPAMPAPSYDVMGPAAQIFKAMRTPGQGETMVLENNFFVEMILPGAVVRTLSDAEREAYREPFKTKESRKPTLQWPRELPIGGEPAETVEVVTRIGEWMRETETPMLHFWATPGALNPEPVAKALVEQVKNLQSQYVGAGVHYLQEDHPELIGRTIADWRRREVGE